MPTIGSLFSGLGGIDLAFEQAGFQITWQVEVDKDCNRVRARHWPNVQQFGDVTECGVRNLSKVDVIAGGFPCQDLSVAGRREGLAGERSGLFYEMARIVDEIGPSFLFFENVPGLLSSDNGRDFARVLTTLDGIGFDGAWTVLDARFFGLAQRRRGVFGVFAKRDIGAGCCGEILSLASRLCGNFTPCREERARVAACLDGSPHADREAEGSRLVFGGANTSGPIDVATACNAKGGQGRMDFDSETFVAHALRSEGADASEDGTGRGTPIVVANCFNGQVAIAFRQPGESLTLQRFEHIMTLYAISTKTRPVEILRLLRSAAASEEISERLVRKLTPFWPSAILQSDLHGDWLQGKVQSESAASGGAVSRENLEEESRVRVLRYDRAASRRTPQRRESAKQRVCKFDNPVPLLPYEAAQAEGDLCDLWRSSEGTRLLQQALVTIQKTWRSAGLQDSPEKEMSEVRRLVKRQGPLRKALYGGEEGGDASSEVTDQLEGDRGVSTYGVRRLTPL